MFWTDIKSIASFFSHCLILSVDLLSRDLHHLRYYRFAKRQRFYIDWTVIDGEMKGSDDCFTIMLSRGEGRYPYVWWCRRSLLDELHKLANREIDPLKVFSDAEASCIVFDLILKNPYKSRIYLTKMEATLFKVLSKEDFILKLRLTYGEKLQFIDNWGLWFFMGTEK